MTILRQLFSHSRHIVLYGVFMALLIWVLKWLEWKYLITDNASDIYLGLIAVLFTLLGIWVATQLVKPKIETVIIEKEVYVTTSDAPPANDAELKKLNLTARETEVLLLITQGHTNAEIADRLFLSLSTIKTHVSNLLVKMEVKNRAQAIEKANRLRLTQR
jgi:two-component system, NarL family, response regulator LiaR